MPAKVAQDDGYEAKVAEAKATCAQKQSDTDKKRWEEKANSYSRQLVQAMKDWKVSSEQKQAKIDTQARNLAVKEHEARQLCKANDDLNAKVEELSSQVDKWKKACQDEKQEWKKKY